MGWSLNLIGKTNIEASGSHFWLDFEMEFICLTDLCWFCAWVNICGMCVRGRLLFSSLNISWSRWVSRQEKSMFSRRLLQAQLRTSYLTSKGGLKRVANEDHSAHLVEFTGITIDEKDPDSGVDFRIILIVYVFEVQSWKTWVLMTCVVDLSLFGCGGKLL